MYNTWKTPEELNKDCIGSLKRRESKVIHALFAGKNSVQNVWKYH